MEELAGGPGRRHRGLVGRHLGDDVPEPRAGGHRIGMGADLDLAVDPRLRCGADVGGGVPGPRGADAGEMGDAEVGAGADGHGVRGGVETGDEARLAVGGRLLDAEPLALADGEGHRTVVLSEDFALAVLDEPRAHRDLVGQPGLRVAVGDEADVVGVGLVRHREAALGRLGADLGLRSGRSDREVAVLELLAGEDAEDVGLVLREVLAAVELGAAGGVADHLGVVPGRDLIEAEGERPVEEGGELDALVAAHARVRGAAGGVLGDEVIDDVLLEPLGEVPHVEGDAEHARHSVGVAGVLDRAAAPRAGAQSAGHPGQGEVDADDLVAGVDGTGGGDGGVDSAGHRDEDLHALS